jgi:DNA (cytosine-5)-methyltransferase 1
LEQAGIAPVALVEMDVAACQTLRANRPHWNVHEGDVRAVNGRAFRGVDILAGGVPCPPFSIAGHRLGSEDERDLFPEMLRLAQEAAPAALLVENVAGFAWGRFDAYRSAFLKELGKLGYISSWKIIQAAAFGVPQLRPRFILVALRPRAARRFRWPDKTSTPQSVGATLRDLMAARGWPGAERWIERASGIAPTLAGGSRKHGGPDLGPTRAKRQWASMGIDALGVADEPPPPDFPLDGTPKLTVRMVARLQGFPDSWEFVGRKTAAYRQIGNALPPPVAAAVGGAIHAAIHGVLARRSKAKPIDVTA